MVKINEGQTPKPLEDKAVSAAKTDKTNQAQSPLPEPKEDKFLGQNLTMLRSALNQIPEINESLVAEIKDKINHGSYEVDPNALAAAMMQRSVDEDQPNQ